MKTRRITAVLLCIALLFGICSASAAAADRTEFGMIDEIVSDSDPQFVSEHEAVLEALFEGCINHEQSINIKAYNVPTDDFQSLIAALLGVYPELFFVENAGGSGSGGYIATVDPVYTVDKDESDAMLDEFYAKADEYLALLDDNMDQFTKALVLHEALVRNNFYRITTQEGAINSTNYTFMVEGWGRCENYAECYAFLLSKVGIKSEIINSAAMVHEWLKINLDGSDYYYHVDITYDDPQYSGYGDLPDKVSHENFLLSDTMIQQTGHSGYASVTETGDTYDNLVNLHSLDNPLFYIDGELYTLYKHGSNGYIATYDYTTDSYTDRYTITDKWAATEYGAGYYWTSNYSGIGEWDGLLYYNGDNCVYVYDPLTGEAETYIPEALDDGRHLYGLYVKDGEIYGRAAASPNDQFQYEYVGDCITRYNVLIDETITHGTVTPDVYKAQYDETVTLTVEPDDGWYVDTVAVNGEALTPEDGAYSFTMPDTDAVVTASFIDVAEPTITKHSLSLNGDIGVNFYAKIPAADQEDTRVVFTWEGNSDTPKELTVPFSTEGAKDGQYKFTCPVSAAEMNDTITAVLYCGDEETDTDTYSARDYANVILYDTEWIADYQTSHTDYAQLSTLVKTMLNYGTEAQNQFGHRIDQPANENVNYALTPLTQSEINGIAYDLPQKEDFPELNDIVGAEYHGCSLLLKSKTTLRFYFKVSDKEKFDQSAESIALKGMHPVYYYDGEKYAYVEYSDIAAKELSDPYQLSAAIYTADVSALAYVKNVLSDNSADAQLKTTVTALYRYYEAAAAYFV